MVTVQQKSKSRGLGKGLSALISEADALQSAEPPTKTSHQVADNADTLPVEGLLHVPLSSVVANRYQPRQHFDDEKIKELARSIKVNGVMQPIVVRSSSEFAGKFEIIAGERRFRASEQAGLKEVPILLRDLDDTQALEMAIVENIQRQDLNPLEEAQGYQRLMEEFSYTQEKTAKTVGKSRSHVANLLRLLVLPENVKQRIHSGELTMGHARALLTSEDPEKLADLIIAGGLSVRQAETLVKESKPASEKPPRKPREIDKPVSRVVVGRFETAGDKDEDIIALEQMLTENLGLNVEINDLGGQQGQMVISYDTLSQLDGLLQLLDGR